MTIEPGVPILEREKRLVIISGNLPKVVAMTLAAGETHPARVTIIGLVAAGAVFWNRVIEIAAAMTVGATDVGVSAE